MARTARPAFTLIEVVVVMAIIGLAIAILIPAVQMARESARNATCVNNLRQLGIALNSYHSSVGCYPPQVNGNKGFSVHAMILPYLDQLALFNSMNFQVRSVGNANSTSRGAAIASFLCPSDAWRTGIPGWTNYACNVGYDHQDLGWNGAFAPSKQMTNSASITDGLHTTSAFSEWRLGLGSSAKNPKNGVYAINPQLASSGQFDLFVNHCINLTGASVVPNKIGQDWSQGSLGRASYNHDLALNMQSCYNGSSVIDGAWTAGSQHPGGANVGFMDGHIQFVRNSIALPVWRACGSRAGGEILSPSDL